MGIEKITGIIEDEDCSCREDVIKDRIQQEWVVPEYRNIKQTAEEVRETVAIVLHTNPKFSYDTKNPVRYCVPLTKKVRKRNAEAAAALQAALAAKKKEESSSASESEMVHLSLLKDLFVLVVLLHLVKQQQ